MMHFFYHGLCHLEVKFSFCKTVLLYSVLRKEVCLQLNIYYMLTDNGTNFDYFSTKLSAFNLSH